VSKARRQRKMSFVSCVSASSLTARSRLVTAASFAATGKAARSTSADPTVLRCIRVHHREYVGSRITGHARTFFHGSSSRSSPRASSMEHPGPIAGSPAQRTFSSPPQPPPSTLTSWWNRFLEPKPMPPRKTFAWYREITLICTVFAITGTSTMMLVSEQYLRCFSWARLQLSCVVRSTTSLYLVNYSYIRSGQLSGTFLD
jgi:hypothetical protein